MRIPGPSQAPALLGISVLLSAVQCNEEWAVPDKLGRQTDQSMENDDVPVMGSDAVVQGKIGDGYPVVNTAVDRAQEIDLQEKTADATVEGATEPADDTPWVEQPAGDRKALAD
jgi:hypothetical protein